MRGKRPKPINQIRDMFNNINVRPYNIKNNKKTKISKWFKLQ